MVFCSGGLTYTQWMASIQEMYSAKNWSEKKPRIISEFMLQFEMFLEIPTQLFHGKTLAMRKSILELTILIEQRKVLIWCRKCDFSIWKIAFSGVLGRILKFGSSYEIPHPKTNKTTLEKWDGSYGPETGKTSSRTITHYMLVVINTTKHGDWPL